MNSPFTFLFIILFSSFSLINSTNLRKVAEIPEIDSLLKGFPINYQSLQKELNAQRCTMKDSFNLAFFKSLVSTGNIKHYLNKEEKDFDSLKKEITDLMGVSNAKEAYINGVFETLISRHKKNNDLKEWMNFNIITTARNQKNSIAYGSLFVIFKDEKYQIIFCYGYGDFKIEYNAQNACFLGSEGAERLLTLGMAEYRDTLSPETRQVMRLHHGSDIAHKVVGVGSVGTRALVMVLEGASLKDPLVLQLKEAGESVLERFCERDDRKHHGRRVVEGQKALQAVSDALLGWCTLPDENGKPRDFYVRQLWNGKGSFDLTTISEERLAGLAAMCGWTLAHAHARTGDRFAIAGYLGKKSGFDHAMVKFARAYADQNEADFQRFVQAVSDSDKQ